MRRVERLAVAGACLNAAGWTEARAAVLGNLGFVRWERASSPSDYTQALLRRRRIGFRHGEAATSPA
ncbi:hypothetical protein [Amycolatopsis dendrobii]|uniref:hypothetical protein n=1 Tax=Amycolatopsis dendrobii TaxID=2760662 RepID=UPI001FE5E5A5|nr:hypothetical protein [Amycolatopsis dendrobii]